MLAAPCSAVSCAGTADAPAEPQRRSSAPCSRSGASARGARHQPDPAATDACHRALRAAGAIAVRAGGVAYGCCSGPRRLVHPRLWRMCGRARSFFRAHAVTGQLDRRDGHGATRAAKHVGYWRFMAASREQWRDHTDDNLTPAAGQAPGGIMAVPGRGHGRRTVEDGAVPFAFECARGLKTDGLLGCCLAAVPAQRRGG
jgi:hypothetical protein